MDAGVKGPGVAVILQVDGRIEELLRLPPDSLLGPGVPFEAIIEGGSRAKADLFLDEIRQEGAAFGWELGCFIENRPQPYLFTGLRLDDRFLIICAPHQESLIRLFEEITAVTEIRPSIFRAAFRQLAVSLARRSDARAAEIEDLTRLNRELSSLQEELTRKNAELEVLNAENRRLAETDALTGLLNRRGFFLGAERDFLRARRYNQKFGVILIDIDHFKDVNDRWGHQVGDQALAGLAAVLKAGVRDSDLLARYGGEEFMLIALDGDVEAAGRVADRLRQAIEDAEIATDAGLVRLTVSIGVAAYEAGTTSLDEIIGRADRALYEAKSDGRNRVRRITPA
jgi:diguanylate cyclase (GGDEF)-like protein